MPRIQILVGMIASGKSTYASYAAKCGYLCSNDDAIVNLIHADQYTAYDKRLKILYKELEHNIIAIGLSFGRNIVIDRGLNVSKESRQRFICIANSYDVKCEAIVFPIQHFLTHAERRYKTCPRGRSLEHWIETAKQHHEIYCGPPRDEGFSKIYYPTYEEIKNGIVY